MTTYREHVHRALSVHHAKIERFLAKAREQEPFVHQICQRLNRHQIPFTFALNADLDAKIWLLRSFSGSLNVIFEYESWQPTPRGFVLSSRDGAAEVEFIYESDV